jgi:4'-phosphopantetheinyl transferase
LLIPESTHLHWLGPPPAAARAEDLEILSREERERFEGFAPVPGARFSHWRAELRRILGDRLGIDPRRVDIETLPGGKPVLRESSHPPGAGLHFNLSHSRDLALLATGPRPLGVDVEFARPRDFRGLARWAFRLEDREIDAAPAQTSADLSTWFYRRWTRQEAMYKLCGGDWITVQRHDFQPGEFLWEGARVFLRDVEAPAGYFAALAGFEPTPG